MTRSKKSIKSLAVSYHAFQEARRFDDEVGTRVWSSILLTHQTATGVELCPAEQLKFWMSYAKRVVA